MARGGAVSTESTQTTQGRLSGAARTLRLGRLRVALPDDRLAARLTLLGVVVALQNLLELPRELFTAALGPIPTSLLMFLALGGSLALLLRGLAKEPPRWRWLRSPGVRVVVLTVSLVAALFGLKTFGSIATSAWHAPDYPNDGTTLDHYAAQELLRGHNPYVTTDIFAAMRLYKLEDTSRVTPLRRGVFSDRPWTQYPTRAEIRRAFPTDPARQPERAAAFETHVSYPALAFLPLVPFVWAGLPSVVPFFGLCFLALVALLLLSAPPTSRPWLSLLILADTPLLDATVAGDLDVFYVLLLFVAWRYARRPIASTVAFGLALAAKQLAWFYLPYYAILVWRERGPREALLRLAGAGGIFLAINAPFIINNPRAWLAGVLAPQLDPMFPLGNGLVRLSLVGLLPLFPSWAYLVLEAGAMLACIVWYARYGHQAPETALVLGTLPLFFAWRSLTTYFYFVALPAVALILARKRSEREAPTVARIPLLPFLRDLWARVAAPLGGAFAGRR